MKHRGLNGFNAPKKAEKTMSHQTMVKGELKHITFLLLTKFREITG